MSFQSPVVFVFPHLSLSSFLPKMTVLNQMVYKFSSSADHDEWELLEGTQPCRWRRVTGTIGRSQAEN